MAEPTKSLVTMNDPASAAAEAFRQLRTNITLRDFDKKIKVINVISTGPQESKSTTTLNLAYTYSQLGRRVLVIDMDLRLPSIHKKLNLRNKVGITDVIGGQCRFESAVNNYAPNFDVLTSGTKVPFASEFVQSKALKDFLESLKLKYSLILIDCPPVGLVTDGVIASGLCDGTVLCLASGKNERKELERTKDILEQMQVNVLGIVMTRMPQMKKYYGSYGGYYGSSKKGKKK